MAVKGGMDENKAFEAITINAARNCKISDRVGSLETGKDADICIFSDSPVKFGAVCKMTFIDGKHVF